MLLEESRRAMSAAQKEEGEEEEEEEEEEECRATTNIVHLLRPIRTATSQQEQLNALQSLRDQLSEEDLLDRELVAVLLLQDVVVVGTHAKMVLLDTLEACGALSAILAAIQTLKDISHNRLDTPTAYETSLQFLKSYFCEWPKQQQQQQQQQQEPVWLDTIEAGSEYELQGALDRIVSLCLLLPGLVANASQAMKAKLPAWVVQSRYYPRLVECACGMALCSSQTDSAQTGVDYFQRLLTKMIQNRGGEDIALGLYIFYKHVVDKKAFSSLLCSTCSQKLGPRESAVLCRALVQHCLSNETSKTRFAFETPWSSDWLEISCIPILAASCDVQDAFVRQSILSPQGIPRGDLADRRLCHCMASLLAIMSMNGNYDSDGDKDGDYALRRHVSQVGSIWSQTVFIRQTDTTAQRHVTFFLLSCLRLLQSPDVMSDSVPNLLEGVTMRLESSIDSIRKDGMRLGEQLGECLGQEIRFEELNYERQKDLWAKRIEEESPRSAEIPPEPSRKKKRERNKVVDPDAEYVSDDEENELDYDGNVDEYTDFDDDSVWDDDSNLLPYNLDDDEEDLRATARPFYLQECLDMLRTAEADDHACDRHETALKELPALVRSRPMDLADFGSSIATELLRMENKFNIEHYAEMLSSTLCALTVEEPISVGHMLIAEVFRDGGSLYNRTTALSALDDAAFELCGNKQLLERREPKARQASLVEPRISGKRALTDCTELNGDMVVVAAVDRVLHAEGSRSRRWGKGRRSSEDRNVTNRFASVAPVWFYSLVGNFVQEKDDAALWGGATGSMLLSRLFITLAGIVECCGKSPGSELLAKDMLELVWNFKAAEVPEIRMSVLCAVATSIEMVQHDFLLGCVITGSTESLPQCLQDIAINDPEDSCRSLARVLSSRVMAALESAEPVRRLAPESMMSWSDGL